MAVYQFKYITKTEINWWQFLNQKSCNTHENIFKKPIYKYISIKNSWNNSCITWSIKIKECGFQYFYQPIGKLRYLLSIYNLFSPQLIIKVTNSFGKNYTIYLHLNNTCETNIMYIKNKTIVGLAFVNRIEMHQLKNKNSSSKLLSFPLTGNTPEKQKQKKVNSYQENCLFTSNKNTTY